MPYSKEELANMRIVAKKREAEGKPPIHMSTVPVTTRRPDRLDPNWERDHPTEEEEVPVGDTVPLVDAINAGRLSAKVTERLRGMEGFDDFSVLTFRLAKGNADMKFADRILIRNTTTGKQYRVMGSGSGAANSTGNG